MRKISQEIALKLSLFTFVLAALILTYLYHSYHQSIVDLNLDKGIARMAVYSEHMAFEFDRSTAIVDQMTYVIEKTMADWNQETDSGAIHNLVETLNRQVPINLDGHGVVRSISYFFYPDDRTKQFGLSYSVAPNGEITKRDFDFPAAVNKAANQEVWREVFEEGTGGDFSKLYPSEVDLGGDNVVAMAEVAMIRAQRMCVVVIEMDPVMELSRFQKSVTEYPMHFILTDGVEILYDDRALSTELASDIMRFVPNVLKTKLHKAFLMDSDARFSAAIAPVKEGWYLIGLFDKSDLKAYADMRQFPWGLISVVILTFILISLYWLITSITKPLRELTGAVLKYEGVHTPFIIPGIVKQRKNEYGVLANAIDGLIERIAQFNEKIELQNSELLDEVRTKEKMIRELSIASKIIDGAREGVCIADKAFRITYVNDMFSEITGFDKAEVIGMDISDLDPRGSQISRDIFEELKLFGAWSGYVKQLKKNGTLYDQKLNLRTNLDKNGDIESYIASFEELVDMPLSLSEHREHDTLTGLIGKSSLSSEIKARMMSENARFAVMLIGIDSFRAINQTLGHEYGDDILRRLTSRLLNAIPHTNTLAARFGGDEFAVLIENYTDKHQLSDLAETILTITNEPFVIDEERVFITASIGICLYPEDADSVDDLFKRMTSALQVAKESGRKTFKFFSPVELDLVNRRIRLMSNLHEGWNNGEFYVVYQPKFDLQNNRIVGAEALMRWRSSALGDVSPVEFIPVAEELGLITQMGAWCIQEAAKHVKQLMYKSGEALRISVNLSYYQLLDEEILGVIKNAINVNRIPPEALELEITEGILMTNIKRASILLGKLKALGLLISIDDFGTGYSSLSYLKNLPIDILKIDRSFIKDIPAEDGAIAKIIIELAKNLSMQVIAEGVETIEQIEFLKANHCYEAQGFFYSKPLEFVDFTTFYIKNNR